MIKSTYRIQSTISGLLENPVAIGFALRAATLDERQNYSGTIFLASFQTAPRPLSSFDTHPRWLPVTQSARSRRSYGKIETVKFERSVVVCIRFGSVSS